MITENHNLFHQGEWSEWLPAASSQCSLYAIDLITRGEARPMVHGGILIEGAWDRSRFEAAVAVAAQRHDGMRVRFASVDDQIMVNAFPFEMHIEDCVLPGETDQDRLRSAGAYCAARLDVTAGRGIMWCVHHDAPDRHLIVMIAHHAILDGLSKLIAMQDIAEAYADGLNSLAPVEAESLESILRNTALSGNRDKVAPVEEFWRDYLTPLPRNLGTEALVPDSEGPTFQRRIMEFLLNPVAIERLFARAEQHSTRPFVVIAGLLAECSADSAPKLVPIAISGRDRRSRRNSVGCFVQTVPMRLHWQGAETFAHLDAGLKLLLQNILLPTDELMSRGILPGKGMFAAPIDMQFQVRKAEDKAFIDRPNLRLKVINAISGVRNLQPICLSCQLEKEPYLSFEFDTALVNANVIQAMGETVQATLNAGCQ